MPNPRRRRARSPYDNATLGVRVRTAEQHVHLNLTQARQRLMEGIQRGEVRPGTGQYAGGYRWHHGNGDSETVTMRVLELFGAGWAVKGSLHPELTAAGVEALETAQRREEK